MAHRLPEISQILGNFKSETRNYDSKYLERPHSRNIFVVEKGKNHDSKDLVQFINSPKKFYKPRRPCDEDGFYKKRLDVMNPYAKVINQRKCYAPRKRPAIYKPTLEDLYEDEDEDTCSSEPSTTLSSSPVHFIADTPKYQEPLSFSGPQTTTKNVGDCEVKTSSHFVPSSSNIIPLSGWKFQHLYDYADDDDY